MSAVTNWFKELVSVSGSTKTQPAAPRAAVSNERQARAPRPQRRGNDVSSIETVTPSSFADAGLIAEVLRDGLSLIHI